MPRKPHVISREHPYHVTARTNNQEWFALPMNEVWKIFSSNLYFAGHAFNLRIHSFVLMSNHFHLLVTSPDGNLSAAMGYLLRETSKEISRRQNRSNHNFKARFFRSLLPDYFAFLCVYKYIYQNPMRAGICQSAHDYKYSTLRQLLGFTHGMIPVTDPILFEREDWEKNLEWLNEATPTAVNLSIKKGLLRSDFKIGNERSKRKPIAREKLSFESDAALLPQVMAYPTTGIKKTLGDEFLRGRA